MLESKNNMDELVDPLDTHVRGYIETNDPSTLAPRGWFLPLDVRLEGENLCWLSIAMRGGEGHGNYLENGKPVKSDPNKRKLMLEEFQKLATIDVKAFGKAVKRYAERWGVLGICRHNIPAAHRGEGSNIRRRYGVHDRETCINSSCLGFCVYNCKPRVLGRKDRYDNPRQEIIAEDARNDLMAERYEPLTIWRQFTSECRSMMRIAIALRSDQEGEEEDWKILRTGVLDGVKDRVWMGKSLLSECINDWLEISGVRPRFLWMEGKHGEFELSGPDNIGTNILSAISVQLMLLVNGSPDYAVCPECGDPFLLRKGQSTEGRAFCKKCGRKAAQKQAVQKYQRKLRAAQPSDGERGQLTEKQAQTIKRKLNKYEGHRFPPRFVRQLAEQYGVSVWTIYKIKERKSWH